MKNLIIILLLNILIIGVCITNVAAANINSKENSVEIYYLNGDWKYEKIIKSNCKDYLEALNYLVSGENLPQGCYNEFPKDFSIKDFKIKNSDAYIEIDEYNIDKIDNINYSMDVSKI